MRIAPVIGCGLLAAMMLGCGPNGRSEPLDDTVTSEISDQGEDIVITASATGSDVASARDAARARAIGDLAAYANTTIERQVEQVLAEGSDAQGAWSEQRFRSDLRATTSASIRGARVIDEQITDRTTEEPARATVSITMAVAAQELFPGRGLTSAIAIRNSDQRLAALVSAGDQSEAIGQLGWAELAYRRAASDPQAQPQHRLAWIAFLERNGDRAQASAALTSLDGAELTQQQQATVAAMRAQLSAQARPLDQSLSDLEDLFDQAHNPSRLRVERRTAGLITTVELIVGGQPSRILALWQDSEDLQRIVIENDGVVHRDARLTFELAQGQAGGTVHLATLPDGDPAWRVAESLDVAVALDSHSDSDRLRVGDLIDALRAAQRRGVLATESVRIGR